MLYGQELDVFHQVIVIQLHLKAFKCGLVRVSLARAARVLTSGKVVLGESFLVDMKR